MKRGKPNSGAVHKPVKDYYAELDKREKELTEGLEKYKARGELVAKAKTYMAQAKAKMDEQYNEIMDLLNVVTGKELTKDEEKLVDGIMLKHIQEQKQKRSVDNGGQAPQTPQKRI